MGDGDGLRGREKRSATRSTSSSLVLVEKALDLLEAARNPEQRRRRIEGDIAQYVAEGGAAAVVGDLSLDQEAADFRLRSCV
jgi:hypothetical protein